eukprot:3409696-Rhodomonas_salina.2
MGRQSPRRRCASIGVNVPDLLQVVNGVLRLTLRFECISLQILNTLLELKKPVLRRGAIYLGLLHSLLGLLGCLAKVLLACCRPGRSCHWLLNLPHIPLALGFALGTGAVLHMHQLGNRCCRVHHRRCKGDNRLHRHRHCEETGVGNKSACDHAQFTQNIVVVRKRANHHPKRRKRQRCSGFSYF